MARTITVNSITNGVVNFTISGATITALNRTYVISGLPLTSRAEFLATVREHLAAYLRGLQAAQIAAPATEVTSISNLDVDQGA